MLRLDLCKQTVNIIFGGVFCVTIVCRTRDPNQRPRRLGAGRCVQFVSCAFEPHSKEPIHLVVYLLAAISEVHLPLWTSLLFSSQEPVVYCKVNTNNSLFPVMLLALQCKGKIKLSFFSLFPGSDNLALHSNLPEGH